MSPILPSQYGSSLPCHVPDKAVGSKVGTGIIYFCIMLDNTIVIYMDVLASLRSFLYKYLEIVIIYSQKAVILYTKASL